MKFKVALVLWLHPALKYGGDSGYPAVAAPGTVESAIVYVNCPPLIDESDALRFKVVENVFPGRPENESPPYEVPCVAFMVDPNLS